MQWWSKQSRTITKRVALAMSAMLSVVLFSVPVAWADWEQTSGPLGGVVNAMLTVDDTVYATLYSGGIYRLEGDRWQQVGLGRGLPENRSFELVADPTDPTHLYSSLMVACGATTTDNAALWTGWCSTMLEQLGVDNFSSDTMAFDSNDPTALYVLGRANTNVRYLLLTTDSGQTWSIVHTFEEEHYFNHLVFFNGVMYVTLRSGGVITSADNGETWTSFNDGISEDGGIRFAIDETNNALYLTTGLYQYNVRVGGTVYKLNSSATGWDALANPTNGTAITVQDGVLWVGTETGETWKQTSDPADDLPTMELISEQNAFPTYIAEFAFVDNQIIIGLGGMGIARSTDNGATWSLYNKGLKSMAMRRIAVNAQNSDQFYAITWDRLGLYASRNGGSTYRIVAGDGYFLSMGTDPNDFTHMYLGGPSTFTEARITKKRARVVERTFPGPADTDIATVAVHPKKPNIVLVGVSTRVESIEGYGVYRTTDNGVTWKKSKGLPDNGVYSIVFAPKKPNIVYVSAFGGGVFKSTDGGKNFSQVGGDELQYTYFLTMHPNNRNILVAASNIFFAQFSGEDQSSGEYGGLYKTEDGGKTWVDLTAGLRDYGDDGSLDETEFEGWKYNLGHLPNYEWVLMNPEDHNNIVVGHHGENVVVTTDNGATWTKPVDGMIPNSIHNYAYCLGTTASFDTIYTCTCGRGMFKGAFSQESKTIQWIRGDDSHDIIRDQSLPLSVTAARQRLLSGEDVHDHSPLLHP